MKKIILQCLAIASIFVLLNSCATMAGGMNSYTSLAEMEKRPELSTMTSLVKTYGIASLVGANQFTILAPNNDAFNKEGSLWVSNLTHPEYRKDLERLLKRHIILKKIDASQINNGEQRNLAGEVVNLGYARIKESFYTTNANIQVIDKVFR
ncbi:MAG: fasciclin domain-containing protein [Bacteroidetes bacterium]|nr:fasciclin domain-containing protein [Bacteroidota bacterium]